MNLRLSLYELARRHQLHADDTKRLLQLGGFEGMPWGWTTRLVRLVAIAGAALGGFGMILWVAANWAEFSRFGRFALLMGAVLIAGIGAAARPTARAPLGLLAMLGIGALFAYFGQTYQTGADAWQLFALWAVLAFPLCLGVRSDVLWAPWALVAMVAVSLWLDAHVGPPWRLWLTNHDETAFGDFQLQLSAWVFAVLMVAGLSPLFQRITGAGLWGYRSAVVLAALLVTMSALEGLMRPRGGGAYPAGVALLVIAATLLVTWRPAFDVFVLSVVALGLNILLISGVARWYLEGARSGEALKLIQIGIVAAALLGASVHGILRLARHRQAAGGAA